MIIDTIDNKTTVKLTKFDIENTNIEFDHNFNIDILQIPLFYKDKKNDLLINLKNNLKGEIEYI